MINDTIAAISTPNGTGAVGMVRISGPASRAVLNRMWISGHNPVDKFETHRLYYGKLVREPLKKGGNPQVIDNVLAVWMGAPHSYTGEDVVEIHCHGGTLSTGEVLSMALSGGARPAEPGEFTRRAFLNGRLDLAQAEGVAEVISATSSRALRLANEQLEGRLSNEVRAILDGLKNIKALVETTIDFPEEDIEIINNEGVAEGIMGVLKRAETLSSTYSEGRLIRDGARAVILGKPNVGKSSILNALLGSERAIVHHLPGTTRDTIEEQLQIDGICFSLIDTAGIRETSCEVEKMGIGKAKERLTNADMALVVLDASGPITDEDRAIMENTQGLKRIVVLNKIDRSVPTGHETGPKVDVRTSAVNGAGLAELRTAMSAAVRLSPAGSDGGVIITNLRHKRLLDDGVSALRGAISSIEGRESAEFIAYHLQLAMDSFGLITGAITTEDVLNEIFSKFCIGK